MKALIEAIAGMFRGPRACRILDACGIDAKRYWVLMDLFGKLSERREVLNQLGRAGTTLKAAAWLYFVMAAFCCGLLLMARPTVETYLANFLGITAFILLSVLLSETSNSLVNPTEGLVLAHQPIDGVTYTAAKLSHLLRILAYLVPGLNVLPALAGLTLKGARWSYPLMHLAAALGVGLLTALLCCALFGWLIRFVPPRRLKAAGQIAEVLPFTVFLVFQYARELLGHVQLAGWWPSDPGYRMWLALAFGVAAAAVVVLGIRSLSGDYLIRVSSIVQGRSAASAKPRRSRAGDMVAQLFGGQGARAGFGYVSRMMVRDWQFRRQMMMVIPMAIAIVVFVVKDWRISPFSDRFTMAHLLPHMFGLALFWICMLLPHGSDYKGTWVFLLAPSAIFTGFARGVHALLWLRIVVIPHALMMVLFAWPWGFLASGLFAAYSAAVASLYLGLELRLIDGMPFGKQPEASQNVFLLPVMLGGAIAIGIGVAVQHFYLFRSPALAAIAAALAGAAAYLATRSSVEALAVSIRYKLGVASAESGTLYKEVDL